MLHQKILRRTKKALVLTLVLFVLTLGFASFVNAENNTAKNIILLIPDGMSLDSVTTTRILKNGPGGEKLEIEKLRYTGYIRTFAANSTVTDSAAAGSALATGEKYNNKEVSAHTKDGNLQDIIETPKTILEIARDKDKATGLVATSQISHATPASFGSHVPNRYCGAEISRQFIEETKVDVVLGGGSYSTSDEDKYNAQQFTESYNNLQSNEAIADLAEANGYLYVDTVEEMKNAVNSGKVFGMFKDYSEGKTPELFRLNEYGLKNEDGEAFPEYPEDEPTLPEMTEIALDILEEDSDGFFLMIEGSQIDWAYHENNINYGLAEMLAFDETVGVVRNWIEKNPLRQSETLVIIAPDHDTAGLRIDGPYESISAKGDRIEDNWTSGDHTGGDVPTWSQGPGSEMLAQPLDNTDIFNVMEAVLE